MTTPVVSLVAMWLFATQLTLTSSEGLLTLRTYHSKLLEPATSLIKDLQKERRLSLVFLGSTKVDGDALAWQRVDTDTSVAEFRRKVSEPDLRKVDSASVNEQILQTLRELDRLVSVRQTIDQRQLDRSTAFQLYTTALDRTFQLLRRVPDIPNANIGRDLRATMDFHRARELLSQEDALLSGAASAGRLTGAEPAQLAGIIGAQRQYFADSTGQMTSVTRAAYNTATQNESMVRLRSMEDRVLAESRSGLAVPIDMAAWSGTFESVSTQLEQVQHAAVSRLQNRSRSSAIMITVRLWVATGLGLLAVIFFLVAAHRMGRRLVGRLILLRRSADHMATDHMPEVLRRIRLGVEIDISEEARPLDPGNDEIGAIGAAFGDIHRAAIESAIAEARLRAGLNQVFLNIARRSQTLLHRQLALLEAMEGATVDPPKLAELFQLDHLATRMRRHAEDLVILAGASPARGWRTPVNLHDVVRGAISEVEDYARITVQTIPEVLLAGPAVADVTHLLSELLENATSFSPPHTQVLVSGQMVPSGLALDIEDRGLGMQVEAIAEANERLAHPPEFDPANSARLGLFVVALLAARHSVTVQLRRSPYGGVTAVALIPAALLVEAPARRPGVRGTTPTTPAPALTGPIARIPMPAGAMGGAPAPGLTPAPADSPQGDNLVSTELEGTPTVEIPTTSPIPSSSPTTPVRPTTPAPEFTEDGLPRRRRQAHLAPQLRRRGSVATAEAPQDPAGTPAMVGGPARQGRHSLPAQPTPFLEHTAEQTRVQMSALQSGMLRGRRDAARLTNDLPANPPPDQSALREEGTSAAPPVPDELRHLPREEERR